MEAKKDAGKIAVGDLRKDYHQRSLSKREMASHPVLQFGKWFREALEGGVPEPNAMTLATAGKDGRPSARIVLLKNFDEDGFVFYTNYSSRKSEQILENPFVSLCFFWQELERQVRVEGAVERTTAAESEEYFNSRPRGSRLAALASPQSAVVDDRETLERIWKDLDASYPEGAAIPCPEHWGGFRVKPFLVEFWQGRSNRLHDRLVYRATAESGWVLDRVAP